MRITEAADRLGISPRMLRYREGLGLLPGGRRRRRRSDTAHRQYDEADLRVARHALELEQRYDVTPAALAFALRLLTEPPVAGDVRELGQELGRVPAPATQALDFEKQRAMRWLGRT